MSLLLEAKAEIDAGALYVVNHSGGKENRRPVTTDPECLAALLVLAGVADEQVPAWPTRSSPRP